MAVRPPRWTDDLHLRHSCIDDRLYQLCRADKLFEIEPKAFDLLAYLLHNRDRVVSKDELLKKL
jgi:DNA-binding winged helix-turn-helix (wHTH) protein